MPKPSKHKKPLNLAVSPITRLRVEALARKHETSLTTQLERAVRELAEREGIVIDQQEENK